MVTHLPKSKIYHRWLLVVSIGLLLMIGIWFRFFKLGSQSYWLDEGFTVNAIMSAMEKGRTILDSGIAYRCATYCYPSSWIIKYFGLASPAGFRLIAAVSGSLMVLLIFFVGRELFRYRSQDKLPLDKGDFISLLAAVFVTFSYWQVAWSRQARWYTLLELTFWLSIIFFWRAMYKPRYRWVSIMLCTVFAILAAQTQAAAYLLIPIYLIWFVTDKALRREINLAVCLKLLCGVAASFLIIFLIDLLTASHFVSGYIGGIQLHYTLPYYLSFYLRQYWLFILIFLLSMWFRKNTPLIALEKLPILFLSQILIIFFLAFGLFSDTVQYRYLFVVTPAFYLLGSYGIIGLSERFHGNLAKAILASGFVAVCILFAHLIYYPSEQFYLESDNPAVLQSRPFYAFTAQPDFKSAYDYLRNNSGPDDLIISTAPVFNKIFLGKAGYWLQYPYLGPRDQENYVVAQGREKYVGAETIADSARLEELVTQKHGYILLDSMAVSQKTLSDEIRYARSLELVYGSETNQFSKIWIYRF